MENRKKKNYGLTKTLYRTLNMDFPELRFCVLPGRYAICSFPPDATLPDWVDSSSFFSVTKTHKEITVVCEENQVPGEYKKSENWKCIKVEGSFDFDTVGILAGISGPLAQSKISLYVISTFETDYVLIHAKNINRAVSCLEKSGHSFIGFNETELEK